LQVGGDLHRQWAEQVPDHEAQVEIQESGKQGRDMPGFPEARIQGTPHGAETKKRRFPARVVRGGERRLCRMWLWGNRRWLPGWIKARGGPVSISEASHTLWEILWPEATFLLTAFLSVRVLCRHKLSHLGALSQV